jgi:hypothetical protein
MPLASPAVAHFIAENQQFKEEGEPSVTRFGVKNSKC